MAKLDINFVREQFPAFQSADLKGQGFFENAGGSYTCGPVIDRLTRFYTHRKVQPYGAYKASQLGGEEMDEARDRLSGLMGIDPDQLNFGPSTTQNTYVLSKAFAKLLNENDAIIVTNQDHEANSGPWRRLVEEGVEVREWGVNPDTGHLDINDLKNLLDKKVKLVCFPHCSNIVGEINPVKEIVKLVRDAGAYSCVDGVSYAPHGFPNIGDLQPDVYLFSTYKTYGPHQGIMVLSERLNSALPNQAHYFNADYPTRRFTPAGPDHAQIAACAGMADYFDLLYDHHFEPQADAAKRGEAVHDLLRSHEVNILQPLLDNLSSRNSVRLLGPDDANKRAPTVAVEVSSNAFDIAKNLSKEGINAGGGDFYAVRLLDALGVDRKNGALRLSFVHYTSEEEVSHLIKILDKVL